MRNKLPMQFRVEAYVSKFFYDYTCDTPDDLASLPDDCFGGSRAFVCTPPSIYMKNTLGNWVLQCFLLNSTKESDS